MFLDNLLEEKPLNVDSIKKCYEITEMLWTKQNILSIVPHGDWKTSIKRLNYKKVLAECVVCKQAFLE